MPACLISFGSNLGDRAATFRQAREALAKLPQTHITAFSRDFWSRPIGGRAGQGDYLNAAMRLETSRTPEALLRQLQHIETKLGRVRKERWGPRTADLDLLLYGHLVIDKPHLTIPHPRMAFRRFVVEPAADVAPEMEHPVIGWSMRNLLNHLNSTCNYVAIVGPPGVGKHGFSRQLFGGSQGQLMWDRDPGKGRIEGPMRVRTPNSPSQALTAELRFLHDRAARLDRLAWHRGLHAAARTPHSPTGPSPTGLFEVSSSEKARAGEPLPGEAAQRSSGEAAPGKSPPGESPPAESAREPLSVSAFWLDQSLCYGRIRLDTPDFERLQTAWQQLASKVIHPKMIVALIPGLPEVPPAAGIENREKVIAAIEGYLAQGGHGPVLRLTSADRQQSLREARAAVQAIQ